MKLEISSDKVLLKLSRAEKFLTVRRTDFEIPVSGIQSIELVARLNWGKRQIRFPGTYIPGIIKAGSYRSRSGWEFWYAIRNQPCLIISGRFGKFRRVVLGLPQVSTWYTQLVNKLITGKRRSFGWGTRSSSGSGWRSSS
jgi:hypothetical protein